MARVWRRDHTVWGRGPREVVDRLGWLTLPRAMEGQLAELEEFAAACAAEGLTTAVLCGMGGSSLAPEVLRSVFGVAPGRLDVLVLDSTHPHQVLAVDRAVDPDRALFLIFSKSGTTAETLAHLAHFWDRVPDGSRFVAVTDPGTPLASLAARRGFRRVFVHPPDVGGRYAALSPVGLVPGALLGVDLGGLLRRAREAARACGPEVPAPDNPGAWLGAWVGEAARAGRDKLTLVLEPRFAPFGLWVEQLVAESTGKEGRGVVPVVGEDPGPAQAYGEDRLFVVLGGGRLRDALDPLASSGHPVLHLPLEEPLWLGGEFFRWELAVAVAGHVLGIHPFDQPDVERTKAATRRFLEEGTPRVEWGDPRALLGTVRPGDYVAVQAFVPRTEAWERRLQAIRLGLRDRLRVATTVGFGPRFLHSTGQLHKGGPPTGVFLQVVEEPREDVPVPGAGHTFGQLLLAQAAGDLHALLAAGRRAARVRVEDLEGAASR